MGSDPTETLNYDYYNCSCFKAKVLDEFTRIIEDEIHRMKDAVIVDQYGKDDDGISYVNKIAFLEQETRTLDAIKSKMR